MVRRRRQGLAHQGPASRPSALRALLILAGAAVKSALGGAVVGGLLAGLVLLVGVAATVAIVLTIAGVAIVGGAIDYVRTH